MRLNGWLGVPAETPVAREAPSKVKVAAIIFGVWTLYGLLLLSQPIFNNAQTRPPWKPWGPYFYFMAQAWAWAVVTPLIIRVVRRLRGRNLVLTAGVHISMLLAIHAFVVLVDSRAFYFVSKTVWPFFSTYPRGIVESMLLYTATALAVTAIDHARLARDRALHAAALEADLNRARLDSLRRQIHPHFLFNTLNTVNELIETDPARAGVMVTQLGELLRRTLDQTDKPLIALEMELKFVRLYTAIERVRFESWLEVSEEIDPATLNACVPPMILQPLVENAIKHGIAPLNRRGTVCVRSRQIPNQRLRLEVIDDGVGLQGQSSLGNGIGFSATRERVIQIFGADSRCEISSGPGSGTRVTIEIPLVTNSDRVTWSDALTSLSLRSSGAPIYEIPPPDVDVTRA